MRRLSRSLAERRRTGTVGGIGMLGRLRRSDAGDTLIEVLLALVVIGLCSVGLLLGFGTTITGSSEYRNLATIDTVLRTAVEEATTQLQQQSSTLWGNCGGAAAVVFNAPALPSGYSGAITSATYWNGLSFAHLCTPNSPQLITITVTYKGVGYAISTVVADPLARSIPVAGASTQLAFVSQPGNSVAGSAFSTPPVVAVEDANHNIATTDLSTVTLTLTALPTPNGATLSQSCTGNWYAGVVTFSNCSIPKVGTYDLTATDGTLTPAVSSSFTVVSGAASATTSTVVANPIWAASNASTSSTVTVTLEDANGNAISGKTISLSAGSGASTIVTGTDPTDANGAATFTVTDNTAQSVSYTATDTTDSVTLVSTATVTFEAGPTVSITTPASSTIYSAAGTHVWGGTVSGTASESVGPGVGGVQVSIHATSGTNAGKYWNGTSSSWQSGAVYNNATGTTSWSYSFAVPAASADGNYTFTAVGTDTAGVVGASSSISDLFDSTAPIPSAPTVNGYA